jgi:hypothetical protein
LLASASRGSAMKLRQFIAAASVSFVPVNPGIASCGWRAWPLVFRDHRATRRADRHPGENLEQGACVHIPSLGSSGL